MAIMFTPPEPPDPQTLQAECQSVVDEVVTMAPERVIEAHKRDQEKAEETGGQVAGDRSGFQVREQAIREAALRVGAQAGLHWRYTQIDRLLSEPEITGILDQAFRFGRMLTEDNVLYPVISEAKRSFSTSHDGQSARSSRITWRIIQPARIAAKPPTWRTYLHQSTQADLDAPRGLMPYDAEEKALWRERICEGFADGVEQANLIFQDRMTRLVRDYAGMLRYRTLEAQNIVSTPKVEEGRLGVRIEADGEKVFVDDRIIRITNRVEFQGAEEWDAVRSLELPGGEKP